MSGARLSSATFRIVHCVHLWKQGLTNAPANGKIRPRATAHHTWGCSSAGRASRSQRGGRGFESHHLHHVNLIGGRKQSFRPPIYVNAFWLSIWSLSSQSSCAVRRLFSGATTWASLRLLRTAESLRPCMRRREDERDQVRSTDALFFRGSSPLWAVFQEDS